MPFQYEGYRSPFANSIAELMLRRGDIAARQAEQSGNAWAGAAQTIGQSVAAIPQQIQQAKAVEQEQELRGLQLKGAQRQQADVDALDNAGQQPGGRDAILKALPGHLRPIVAKQFADLDKQALDTKKLKAEVTEKQNEYLAGLGAAVQSHNYDPTAAALAISHAREHFGDDPDFAKQLDDITQQIQANPGAIKGVADGLVALSPKRVELAQTGQAHDETARHNTATETQAATTGAEALRHNTATEATATANATREAAAAAETARHNRVTEGREQKKFDATYGAGVDENGHPLPEDPTAKGIAEYRIPPPSARSMASGPGKALMDRVTRLNPGYDASQFPARSKMRQAFTSGSQAQQLTALNTAVEHLGKLDEMASALNNGSFKPGNQAYNWVRTTFGDSAVTNYRFATDIMSGELATAMKKSGATDVEISKVTKSLSDANSPKQLSDAIRKVAIPMIGGKASTLDQQWKQVMGEQDPFSVYTPGAKAVLQKFSDGHEGGGGAHTSTMPANVSAVLKGQKPGRYTLSDGSVWLVQADGSIQKGS